MLLLQYHTFQQGKAMPKFCIAANCSTTSGDCYNRRSFLKKRHYVQNGCSVIKVNGMVHRLVLCSALKILNKTAS